MCILRDESPESAMQHYNAMLAYASDMIIGIGLDSTEEGRPPNLFQEVFAKAKKDGYRITTHCDVGKVYPVEHIRQAVSDIKVDRIDHGLNIVDNPELMATVRDKGIGMTICPWSYIRHQPFEEVFRRIRILFDAGIPIAIGSDDPAFMEDTWILENLLVMRKFCGLTNEDVRRLGTGAVEMCWATEETKQGILSEMERVWDRLRV